MAIIEWLAIAAVGGLIHSAVKESRKSAAEEQRRKILHAILMTEYPKSNLKL